jgi:hypothetical protein
MNIKPVSLRNVTRPLYTRNTKFNQPFGISEPPYATSGGGDLNKENSSVMSRDSVPRAEINYDKQCAIDEQQRNF